MHIIIKDTLGVLTRTRKKNYVAQQLQEVIDYLEGLFQYSRKIRLYDLKPGKIDSDGDKSYHFILKDDEGGEFQDDFWLSIDPVSGEYYDRSETYDMSDQMYGLWERYCEAVGVDPDDYIEDDEW